jgi:hypothetical protein
MQIDKFVPRQLNTDSDQRYLEQGELIDAVNITLNEDGANSAIVVKNQRGTRAFGFANITDAVPEYPMTVIGSVSDPQRSRVYVFAASNEDNANRDDIVYMIDMIEETYSVVYRTPSNGTLISDLNFDPNSFVKADVLNKDIQRDNTITSILYFTDDINPPRKINVDKALEGAYNQYTNVELQFVINSIVPAPTRDPSFRFETDDEFQENNLSGKCFQFATQFIFDDGEESAISPYSSLAFVDETSGSAVVFSDDTPNIPSIFGSIRSRNNVCLVDTKYATGFNVALPVLQSAEMPEVSRIRILAREDNNGAWFVADEVSTEEETVRTIGDQQVVVFSPQSGIYRFYNDGAYRTVSTIQIDKLYDNVPRVARGQTISGDRLVYSNYLEGYNNLDEDGVAVDPSHIQITPVYQGANNPDGNGGINANDVVSFETSGLNVGQGAIVVDWVAAFADALDSTFELEEGSEVSLSFRWTPEGTVQNADSQDVLLSIGGVDSNGDFFRLGRGSQSMTDSDTESILLNADTIENSNRWSVNFTYVAESGDTISDLSNAFANYVEDIVWVNTFKDNIKFRNVTAAQDIFGSEGHTSTVLSAPVVYTINDAEVKYRWKFTTDSSAGTTYIRPSIFNAELSPGGSQVTQGNPAPGFPVTFVNSGSGPAVLNGILQPGYSTEDLPEGTDYVVVDQQDEDFGNSQSSGVYTFTSDDPDRVSISTNSIPAQRSFKSGAIHDFGVMYYDRWNRNGPLLKLGSVYAKHLGERTTNEGKGAVHMNVAFNEDITYPEWATSYKILYAGSPYESTFTGVVSGAFVPTDAAEQGATAPATNEYNPNRRDIYVSIEGLEKTKDFMGVSRSYKFAEGDVLRVIQYYKALGADKGVQIPLSSRGSIIEFDVVKVVTLEDNAENPLRSNAYTAGSLTKYGKTGRFLVLRAPVVDSGVEDDDGNTTKYPGFDWFSVAAAQNGGVEDDNRYPYDTDGDGINDTPVISNFWNQECVVEILSKRKRTSDNVYYEITPYMGLGVRREGGTAYGPSFVTDNGSMYFRSVLSTRNQFVNNGWTIEPEKWQYKSILMESDRFADRRNRADWGQGRPHLPLTEPQERRRFNSITYSEADVSDLNTLFLSSFNKNLANYADLNSSFGSVNYISSLGESMIALQENKVSRLSVNRQVVTSADGTDANIALSSSPFNVDIYFSGDYGCGNNPESVLVHDNQVFFADVSRSAVCRLASSQLYPISEKKTSSLFNTIFNNVRAAQNPRIVSGYDPSNDMYYVTFGNMGANNETVGYSVFGGTGGDGGWISRYTFYPTNYSNQNNLMLSMSYLDPNLNLEFDQQLMHAHDGNLFNTFYGDAEPSDFTYVSKIDPSRVHTFDAISHEGNSNNWNVQSINTDLMGANDNANTLAFVEREGTYYAYITRDPGGSKHLRFLGTLASATTNSLTFDNRINNQPVPANSELMAVSGGSLVTLSNTPGEAQVQSVTGARSLETIAANIDTGVATDGTQVVIRTPANLDGDPVRGHYATIRMTNNATAQFELFCVNTVLTMSQIHHYRGQ